MLKVYIMSNNHIALDTITVPIIKNQLGNLRRLSIKI